MIVAMDLETVVILSIVLSAALVQSQCESF